MAIVKHRVGVVGDISTIFLAMHEPKGLEGWWATKADGKTAIGEILNLHFSRLAILSFKIVALCENSFVHLHCVSGPGSWQDCDLTFSFKQDTDQVWIDLVHENAAASDDDFLYFTTKWPCYLLSLRDFIETGKGRPYPNDIKIHVGN